MKLLLNQSPCYEGERERERERPTQVSARVISLQPSSPGNQTSDHRPSAMATLPLSLVLLLFHFRLSFSENFDALESVPQLLDSMYHTVDGFPCVRLLNLSGEIGCSNPGRVPVVAPVVKFRSGEDLAHPSAVLVSIDEFEQLLDRISNDPNYSKNVGGVLVESGTNIENKGFSPDLKFPGAEFAPYQNKTYRWNSIGSDIMQGTYNFPIFSLSDDDTKHIQELASNNEKKTSGYTYDVAEFDLVMQTTRIGTHTSESCLEEDTCLPLGGYSVWSSLPPINVSSENQKPIILTVASMDSASFFRDKSLGAESPISGLISLLAVVDALSRLDGLGELDKQLVFSVFTGESWGYLGSRRFLLELDQHSDAVKGLNGSHIDMVMEIGSVGKAFKDGNNTFFVHTTEASAATNDTWNALKRAQDSLHSQNITVSSASASNPGIPPSSLMAFVSKSSSISGITLEDFDTVFSNKFYRSELDDKSNINSSAIVAASSLLAHTLYILAGGNNLSRLALSSINVNASLVEELISCLTECDPGLTCELVGNYISTTASCPSSYVGVIEGEPSANPYLGSVNDVSRFIWNFLADVTSVPDQNSSSDCSKGCNSNEQVCVKAEKDGKGVCVTSTTRYVPAYSTRLKYDSDSGSWSVLPAIPTDLMGMVDPVWTESNWNTIGIRVYTAQDASFDRVVLLIGIGVTLLAYLAVALTRAFLMKALKQD